MATTLRGVGSGRFVSVRVWSCPVHEHPVGDQHDGGGDPWLEPGELCLDCETGKWRDKRDETGEVVLRELGAWEAMLYQVASPHFQTPPILWLEDR